MDKFCKQTVNKIIDEAKRKENMCIIENEILDPIIKYIGQRLYPYILFISVLLFVTFLILVYVMYSIHYQRGHMCPL
jgi:hypothetical protein